MFVTKRRDFINLCKRYNLGYEKDKVLNMMVHKEVWANYVTGCDAETEARMAKDGLLLRYMDGCMYPYIYRSR
jgi:hypothetical protein